MDLSKDENNSVDSPLKPKHEDQIITGKIDSMKVHKDEEDTSVVSPVGPKPEEQIVTIDEPKTVTGRPKIEGWRLTVILFCIFFGIFEALLDSSIVATVLVTISKQFNSFNNSNWVVLAYLLTQMGFAMIIARISDIFGRKWSLIVVNVIFGLFSLACGLAQTMKQLIIFRAMQGIGAAGLMTMGFASIPDLVSIQMMAKLSGLVGMVMATAAILGPIMGGAIADRTTWRWVFWLNLPGNVLTVALIYLVWPNRIDTKLPQRLTAIKSIDFIGSILLLAGSILLVFALQEAAHFAYAWDSATIVVCLVTSGLSWVGFFIWESLISKRPQYGIVPMLPMSLIGRRVYGATVLLTGMTGVTFFVALVNIPERAQIIKGSSPILAGVFLLPLLGSSALSSFVAGLINSKRNRIGPSMIAIACFQVVGVGLLSTLPATHSVPTKLFGFEILLGLGIGGNFALSTIQATLESDQTDRGIAQGIVSQVRLLGGSIGLAIATVVLNVKIKDSLTGVIPPAKISLLFTAPLSANSFPQEQRSFVQGVYADGFNVVMRAMTYIAIVTVILSLFTWSKNPKPMEVIFNPPQMTSGEQEPKHMDGNMA